VRNVKLIHRRQ